VNDEHRRFWEHADKVKAGESEPSLKPFGMSQAHAGSTCMDYGCMSNAPAEMSPITLESLEEMKRHFDAMPKIERRELTKEEMVFVEIGIGLGLIEVRQSKSWEDYAAASLMGFSFPRPLSPYLPIPKITEPQ
jgi:hypothetical protein